MKSEKDFQDGGEGGHPRVQIGTILASFDLYACKSPQYFLPSFESIGLSVQ